MLRKRFSSAQERLLAIQVEECQAFIQRPRNRLTRMEQERAAEQKELDAAQVLLTRLREEMMSVSSPGPTQPAASAARSNIGTSSPVANSRRREKITKKLARSFSVPRKILLRPFARHARGVRAMWLCFSLRQGTDLL